MILLASESLTLVTCFLSIYRGSFLLVGKFLFSFFPHPVWKLNFWRTCCKVLETSFYPFERWGKSDVSFCRPKVTECIKRYMMVLVSFSSSGIHGIYGHVITILFLTKLKYLQCFPTSIQFCCWLHLICISLFPEKFKSYNNKREKKNHINWNSCSLFLEKESMNKATTKCILLMDYLIFYDQLLSTSL